MLLLKGLPGQARLICKTWSASACELMKCLSRNCLKEFAPAAAMYGAAHNRSSRFSNSSRMPTAFRPDLLATCTLSKKYKLPAAVAVIANSPNTFRTTAQIDIELHAFT